MCFASGRCRRCAGHCQKLTLDLWVERALVVTEPGLHRAAVVIDDSLWLIGLECVERANGHGRRWDLLEVEGGGHVSVDRAGVDTDHLCALAPQLNACRVREAPSRGLGCRVGREQ